ncbi:MAG: biotin-dependent carboxyltransferase family protein, partial [Chthoniobacterales bacterium]
MNASVLRAGFLSSVQDLGRPGHRASGVSLGGALDPHALAVANLLVGNEVAVAGIEATLGELLIGFHDERVVSWTGGDFLVQRGGDEIPVGHPALVQAGEELSLTAPRENGRAWLGISGGIEVPLMLGSRSTDLRSGFGGWAGRALRDGDGLPLGRPGAKSVAIATRLGRNRIGLWSGPTEWISPAPRHPFLRIVRGADWERFAAASLEAFVEYAFTVGSEVDRMGVRLAGPLLERTRKGELLSEAVVPGTIQVPPSGQPI